MRVVITTMRVVITTRLVANTTSLLIFVKSLPVLAKSLFTLANSIIFLSKSLFRPTAKNKKFKLTMGIVPPSPMPHTFHPRAAHSATLHLNYFFLSTLHRW